MLGIRCRGNDKMLGRGDRQAAKQKRCACLDASGLLCSSQCSGLLCQYLPGSLQLITSCTRQQSSASANTTASMDPGCQYASMCEQRSPLTASGLTAMGCFAMQVVLGSTITWGPWTAAFLQAVIAAVHLCEPGSSASHCPPMSPQVSPGRNLAQGHKAFKDLN